MHVGLHYSTLEILVPDFTISVYGSSCNYLFFTLIDSSFLSLPISWPWHPIRPWLCN